MRTNYRKDGDAVYDRITARLRRRMDEESRASRVVLYVAPYGPTAWEVYSYTPQARLSHGITHRLEVVRRYARMRKAELVRLHDDVKTPPARER